MTIRVYSYDEEGGLLFEEGIGALELASRGSCVWVDIETKDPEILEAVATKFNLHELSIEDCLTPGHFPKLDDYGSYLFMIFRGLKPFQNLRKLNPLLEEEDNDSPPTRAPNAEENEHTDRATRKVAMYLSDRFVITYRRKEVNWLDAVARQVNQYPEQTIAQGPETVAHKVVDVLVDRSLRGLEFFDRLIDDLEDKSVETPEEFEMADLLSVKRTLASLRIVMRDQRSVISKLATDKSMIKDAQRRRYFKDIDDHAITIINSLDKLIDETLGLRDAYFAMANVRLGDTMRILAVITTIGVPLHIVVGLYGMNFTAIPLLHNPHGFWFIVVLMIALAILMLFYFRNKRWI